MHRAILAAAITLAIVLSGCARSISSDRTTTLMSVASSIGSARHAAYWFQQDLTPETYKGATEAELGTLRARAQILEAEADKLDAFSSQLDLFKPKKGEPSLEEVVVWQRELDAQYIDLMREIQVLQVRLGLRTPQDAAMREDLSAYAK
jgi:hypothetical protein